MIKLENLTKKYGNLVAVDHVNLTVDKGEIMAFVGPNGAGKTTTIKIMAGTLKPTDGRAVIGGHDIIKNPLDAKKIVGYIPDRPHIYEKLTGDEFLTFTAKLYGLSGRAIKNRQEKLLELFELSSWKDEPAESYSHGMKQRLVMAGALLHEPKVLIVDEPMVGLDPKAAKMVKNIFREIARQGVCIFMSTHTLDIAEDTANRIAVIMHGEIIALGSMNELQQKAKSDDKKLESIFLKLTGGVVTELGDFFSNARINS